MEALNEVDRKNKADQKKNPQGINKMIGQFSN